MSDAQDYWDLGGCTTAHTTASYTPTRTYLVSTCVTGWHALGIQPQGLKVFLMTEMSCVKKSSLSTPD